MGKMVQFLDTKMTAALISGNGPLVVDLDGTLVRTDTFTENIMALANDWGALAGMLGIVAGGRSRLKSHVASSARIDAALLPYSERFLAYLRAQKEEGRRLVLATAADSSVANAVADHLGLFDEVFASDGTRNLKGEAKARALVDRFGAKGFTYAGNSRADLPVWRAAQAAIIVNAPSGVADAARAIGPVEAEFDERELRLLGLLRAMRPHQWVKNFLVLVPIFTAQAYGEVASWINASLIFAAFCATASGIYIVNDLTDLAADRSHPRKRLRAFASGAVPPGLGLAWAVALIGIGAALAYSVHSLAVIAIYAAASLLYSAKLKEQPLVDVFCLAGFYTIRLFGGGAATGHSLSLWLFGFSSFLFLSLALVKRVEELSSIARSNGRNTVRRGYLASDAAILQIFGCAAAFASSVVLALFVQSEATAQQYQSPGLLWGIVPLMLFWQCRLWLSTARGYMHEDPIVYAAHDWVSWAVGAMLVLLLAVAKSTSFFAF